jgi:hypothetical protein
MLATHPTDFEWSSLCVPFLLFCQEKGSRMHFHGVFELITSLSAVPLILVLCKPISVVTYYKFTS